MLCFWRVVFHYVVFRLRLRVRHVLFSMFMAFSHVPRCSFGMVMERWYMYDHAGSSNMGQWDVEAGLAAIIEAERRVQGIVAAADTGTLRVGSDGFAAVSLAAKRSRSAASFADGLSRVVDDVKTDPRIFAKVGAAVAEGRIPESAIASILPGVRSARCRGAYFLAAAKAEFAKVGLSWIREDWR
jgi:hypothetical protein